MKLNRTTTHAQTTTTTIGADDLKRIIAEAVCREAGIDLAAQGVEHKVWVRSVPVTGTAGSEYIAEVTITQVAQPKGHIDFSGSVRAPIKRGDTIRWHENGVEHSGPVVEHYDGLNDVRQLRCRGLTLEQIQDRADRDSVTIV